MSLDYRSDYRKAMLLGFAAARRQHFGELASLLLDYRELLRELVHLKGEYKALRLELDRLCRLNSAASVVERDGAALH